MQRFLDIPRAAKLAGVSRSEIKRLISEQSLSSVDGKIRYDELLRVFPEIKTSRGAMLEIVSQIKDDAVSKAPHDGPSSRSGDVKLLVAELKRSRQEADHYRDLARKYKQILRDLKPKLTTLQQKSEHKHRIQAVIDWFVHKTKELW